MTERIAVQFSATADFASLSTQIRAINDQLAKTNALYAESGAAGVKNFAMIGKQFEQTVSQMKGWQGQTVQVRSGVNQLTEDIKNQGYSIKNFLTSPIKGLKQAWADAGAVADQQLRLQKSRLVEMSRGATGNVTAMQVFPTGNLKGLATDEEFATARASAMTAELKSSAAQMINLGKNTQWAGRQLTYGLSVPILVVAGVLGDLAFKLEDSENKLRAVYGGLGPQTKQSLDTVTKAAQGMTVTIAKQFGIAGQATMQLEAQLAGMGYKGQDLQTITYQISRLQALAAKGTVEQSDAVNAAIGIMNQFNVPVNQLENVFNKVNAAENRTVLATNDIVTAVPKAGQAISALGGSWKDLIVLMAGMRAAGVPATTAATALNRALGSIVDPSAAAVKMLAALNINVQDIVNSNTHGDKTNIVGIFKDLGVALHGLTNDQQLAAVDSLFSKFQGTRIFTDMKALVLQSSNIGKQMVQAQQAVDETNAQAAANAQKDITARYDTTVGEIRRAIHTIGAELAIAGIPFLQYGADILKVLADIVSGFTHIPKLFQSIGAGALFVVALVGPIRMLGGLLRNLVGQVKDVAAGIYGWATGSQEIETETTILTKIQNTLTETLNTQVSSLNEVTGAVERLSLAYRTLALKQEATIAENGIGFYGGLPSAASSRAQAQPRNAAGQFIAVNNGTAAASKASDEIAEDTAATSVATRSWATGLSRATPLLATAAIGTSLLLSGSKGVTGEIAKWAFPLALMLPILPSLIGGISSLITKIKVATAAQIAFDAAVEAGDVELAAEGPASMIGKLGALLAGFGPLILGVTAVAGAAVVGLVLWHEHNVNIEKDQKAMAAGAQTLASAVGVAWNDANKIILSTGKAVKTTTNQIAAQNKIVTNIEASDQGKRLISGIKGMSDTDATLAAQNYGLQLMSTGASVKQVQSAIQALLAAAGKEGLAYNANITHFNITNKNEIATDLADNLEKQMNEDFSKMSLVVGGRAPMSERVTLSTTLSNQIKTAGEVAAQIFMAPSTSKTQQAALIQQYQQYYANTIGTLQKKIASATNPQDAEKDTIALGRVMNAQKVFIQSFGDTAGLSGQKFSTWDDILKDFNLSLNRTGATGNSASSGLNAASEAAWKLYTTTSSGLASVNSFTSNLQAAVSSQLSGLTSIVDTQYDAMTTAADNANSQQQQSDDTAYANRTKAATTYYNYLASMAGKGYDIPKQQALALFNAEVKGTGDVANARKAAEELVDKYNKNTETRVKTVTDHYNKEIDAIKAKQKAESAAAAEEQKEYEQQQKDLQAQAAEQNLNIDFNTSIDSGNIGQAAQDVAQAQSDAIQNALDDANAAAQAQAAAEKKASDAKIALLTKERDAQVKSLKAQENARKVWLQNELSDVSKEYDHEKSVNDTRLASAKTANDQMLAMRKTELDAELATMTSMVPKNVGQMNTMIKDIEAAAQKFGVNLNTQSSGWSKAIKDAWANSIKASADKVKNDNAWTKFGTDIANKVTKGIGMTWAEFLKWMATGQLPGGALKQATIQANITKNERLTKNHTGSYVMGDGKFGVKPDESVRVLQDGEWVINKNAVSKYGSGLFHNLNSMKMHTGGEVMLNTPMTTMGMMMAGIMKNAMNAGIMNAAIKGIGQSFKKGGSGVGGSVSLGGPELTGGGALSVWRNLKSIGLTAAQAAGVMGNMKAESGFNPFIIQGGGTSLNPAAAGAGGYGLAQWTPGSKLIPYLHGAAPSIASEVRALGQQLSGLGPSPEGAAGVALKSTSTPSAAAWSFLGKYERPKVPNQPIRAIWAEEIYQQFKKYDSGGVLKGGQLGFNGTQSPEYVFTSPQWKSLSTLANVGASAAKNGTMGNSTYNLDLTFNGSNLDADDVANIVVKKIQLLGTKNQRVVVGSNR